ncbi:helix-turn-helix domain-containing protein [Vibrio sp. 10N.286.52.C3]|uniref:helix-turn-helix domain-containing protein n=1 Tax=unclassified Vibrio TaxID=2614977 RepID=UPI0035538F73
MKKTIHSADYQKLIHWLKDERLKQKLSMRELAARLGCPHSFIGKIEQGERRLDIIEYLSYCEALTISPHSGLDLILNK